MKKSKRYIALLLSALLSFSIASPALAAGSATPINKFWSWLGIEKCDSVFGLNSTDGCTVAIDGKHKWRFGHASDNTLEFDYYCDFCGANYTDYVDGKYQDSLVFVPSTENSVGLKLYAVRNSGYYYEITNLSSYLNSSTSPITSSFSYELSDSFVSITTNNSSPVTVGFTIPYSGLIVPISGQYSIACHVYGNAISSFFQYACTTIPGSNIAEGDFNVYKIVSTTSLIAGSVFNSGWNRNYSVNTYNGLTGHFVFVPLLRIIPDNPSDGNGTTVNSDGFSGISGKFGVPDENDVITPTEEVTLIDTTNKLYYVPVTNTYYDYTDYTFDFSKREFTFNTGDTITYNDNSVTIVNTVNEVSNIYNIYYYADGDPSGDGSDDGSGDGSLWDFIKSLFGDAWEGFKGLLALLWRFVYDLVSRIFDAITEVLGGIIDAIVALFGWFADILSPLFEWLGDALAGFFSFMWEDAYTGFEAS